MVYRKKTYSKKSYPEKKDWRKSFTAKVAEGGLYAASKFIPYGDLAYSAVGKATGFNTEEKYYEFGGTSLFNSPVNGVAPTQSLTSGIIQGLSGQQRAGRSIRLKDLDFDLHIQPDNNGTVAGTHRIRWLLFWDREGSQPPGTAPLHTDVLQTQFFGDTADTRLQARLNVTNFGRFQILKDEVVIITPMATGYGSEFKGYFHHKQAIDHHVTFVDDTIPDNTPLRGHIYFMIMACNTSLDAAGNVTFDTTPGNLPGFFWNSRIRFVDN